MKKFFSTTKRKRPNLARCVAFAAIVCAAFDRGFAADFGADFSAATDRDFAVGVASDFDVLSSPTWALRNAANGIWRAPTGTFAESNAGFDRGFRSDFDADFGENVAILRGQASTAPPVVSPTTSSTIGAATITESTSQIVTPPVVGDDRPFSPIVATTNDDSTTFQKMFKHKQEISASYLFMPKGGREGLGVNEIEARLLFAIPCETMREHSCLNNGFFLLTPSFTYDNWSVPNDANLRYDMPKSTFDAGLSTMFAGRLNDFEIKVETQIGVASSFQKVDCKGVYVRGRAMGALPVDTEKKVKITGGLIYYDRIKYKIVPSGGFVWTPNPQNVVELVYPDPRWSRYLTKLNETDWWFYVRGEIGGGRYLISSPDKLRGGTSAFVTDYDDYRVGVGLTFDCSTRLKGCFEVGGAFKRRLVAKTGTWYSPKDSVYLKAGLLF